MNQDVMAVAGQVTQMLRAEFGQSVAMVQMEIQKRREHELSLPRNQDPKRLLRHGFKTYSQNDEDGIIEEIFRRIGATDRRFVEFGVTAGIECNTLKLLVEGWSGLWLEASPPPVRQILQTHRAWIEAGKLKVREAFVTAENINDLLRTSGMVDEVDLLSVDIDFNDYWVWRAIDVVRPRVVVVEYNPIWRPPMSVTVAYDATAIPKSTNYAGASLSALTKLGVQKGYRLVGCSMAGVNAFFVREDLCGAHFLESATAEEHYEPARHYMRYWHASSAPPAVGPLVLID
jgi:hypothetical protein